MGYITQITKNHILQLVDTSKPKTLRTLLQSWTKSNLPFYTLNVNITLVKMTASCPKKMSTFMKTNIHSSAK